MIDTDTLINRWKDGDEDAARLLYEQYHTQTFRLACGLLDNIEDAEEVMQDALTYALNKINRFDPQRATFTTWLHTITVSRARDRNRRNQRQRIFNFLHLDRRLPAQETDTSPVLVAERKRQNEEILQAIQLLKSNQREVLMLRYWAGHTLEEIAQIVGCPLGTAKSRLRLAHKNLEAILPCNFEG